VKFFTKEKNFAAISFYPRQAPDGEKSLLISITFFIISYHSFLNVYFGGFIFLNKD